MFIPFLLSHSVADCHYLTIESNFAACDERNHSSLLPSLEFFSNGIKLSRKTFFVGQYSEILAHENLVWQVVRGIAHECAAGEKSPQADFPPAGTNARGHSSGKGAFARRRHG